MKRHNPRFVAVCWLLLILGVAFAWRPASAAAGGKQDPYLVKKLPNAVWTRLQHAKGIIIGGHPGTRVRVQVIFDANCPYCALLYKFLRQKHPNLAVRWIPVAYLLPDSGPLAGAILASTDPAASLDTDFIKYDFDGPASHGGFALPKDKHYNLPAANVEIQTEWERHWGGGTPTVFVKNQDGSVTRVLGLDADAVNRLLARGQYRLPEYRN